MTQTIEDLSPKEVAKISRLLSKLDMYPMDEDTAQTYEEPLDILLCAPVSKIEDYIPDGPGWCGNLYTIFWGHASAFTIIGLSNSYDWAENYCEGQLHSKGQFNYDQEKIGL